MEDTRAFDMVNSSHRLPRR